MSFKQKHTGREGGAGFRVLTQAAPVASIDEEARTVEVVFSTADLVPHWVRIGDDVQRMPTRVVLSQEACDLEFLVASGPVLDSHDNWSAVNVLGNVEDAWIEQASAEHPRGCAKARLKFSEAEDVAPIWQRIKDGSLRNVSMGFEINATEIRQEEQDGRDTMDVVYFTRWRPLEISMVTIPADKGSRIQSGAVPCIPNADGDVGEEASAAHATARADQQQAAAAADQSQKKDIIMADKSKDAGNAATQGGAQAPGNGGTPAVTTQAAPDAETLRQQARSEERQRIAQIRETGEALGLGADLIQSAIDSDKAVDDFRAEAIQAFAKKGQDATQGIGGPSARVTSDGRDRFREGALQGVMARAGLKGGERNEFTGLTMAELARQSLVVSNAHIPGDRRQMVGAAFTQAGAHSTSDFANILANLAGKAALKGWEEAEETFQLWTATGTLTDFKPTKRAGLGLISALPEIPEGAEYKYGTVGDRGEPLTMATYGRLLKITRQAIINDDLGLFTSVPVKMGRAARRTIGNLVYAVLTDNDAMSDGTALFHADHNNLAGSGAAPSVTTLGAARAAMRNQVEASDGSPLNITPKYMLVPAELETSSAQLLNSAVDPQSNKGHAANPVAGMAELITDARLGASSTTAWFLAADPNMFDTIEVAYLDGVQEPYIEEKTAWSTDGVELKVRIDAAVGPLDHRGLYKNAGT